MRWMIIAEVNLIYGSIRCIPGIRSGPSCFAASMTRIASEKSYIGMNRPELNIPYHAFEDFVFRAPMFPLKFVEDRSKEEIFNLIQNRDPIIDHALYIASPNLHRKLDRWTAGELKEKSLNFDLSLLKYVTRMSTRCTPVGLFAGIDRKSIRLNSSHVKHSYAVFCLR